MSYFKRKCFVLGRDTGLYSTTPLSKVGRFAFNLSGSSIGELEEGSLDLYGRILAYRKIAVVI